MIGTYDPSVFTAFETVEQARWSILTPQGNLSTEERWARETPWLAELLTEKFNLGPTSTVIDFGCGIGRVAKALIDRCDCKVVGVDFSQKMRALAETYVDSPNFCAMAPKMLDTLRLKADLVLAIWVLQHCDPLTPELDRLHVSLTAKGRLFVLNMTHRSVPSIGGAWIDDGVDVLAELRRKFRPIARGEPPYDRVGGDGQMFWGVFGR